MADIAGELSVAFDAVLEVFGHVVERVGQRSEVAVAFASKRALRSPAARASAVWLTSSSGERTRRDAQARSRCPPGSSRRGSEQRERQRAQRVLDVIEGHGLGVDAVCGS